MRIVDDQISSPTWARTLAEATAQVIAQGRGEPVGYIREKHGLYHLAGGGSCSRYEWAKAILEMDEQAEQHKYVEMIRVPYSDFQIITNRPKKTILKSGYFERSFSIRMPLWLDLLEISFDVFDDIVPIF